MPEGPELHLASRFINAVSKGRIFAGKVRRNPIHKCADVIWDAAAYTIFAVSRGKELKLFLRSHKTEKDVKPFIKNVTTEPTNDSLQQLHLLFNFGMSGKFEFTSADALPKHAHLSFYTKTEPSMALSFVDYRRFGKWQVGADWSFDRGPCVLFEYPQFRSKVLNSLADTAFNKPVCEVLLNQKYFNGIGNYLRAEICYRAGVRPFDQARAVFASLPDVPDDVKVKIENGVKETFKVTTKGRKQDILELCNIIPLEVVGLGISLYLPEDEHSDRSKFSMWLQCYYKPDMKNVADHNKRTMWYFGDPGPMLPKEGGSRKRHTVYDKKLTKNAKKAKQTPSSHENTDDTSKVKMAKSEEQEPPRSPVKTRRITRKSLTALPDEPAKKSTKRAQTKTTVSTAENSKKTESKSGKSRNSSKKGKGKTEEECRQVNGDEVAVVSKAKRRSTRNTVQNTASMEECKTESPVKKSRKRSKPKN